MGSGFNSAEVCWVVLSNMLNLFLSLFHHLKMPGLQLALTLLKVKEYDACADQQGRFQLRIRHVWGHMPPGVHLSSTVYQLCGFGQFTGWKPQYSYLKKGLLLCLVSWF